MLSQQFSTKPAPTSRLSPPTSLKLHSRPAQGSAGQPWAGVLNPPFSHQNAQGENIPELINPFLYLSLCLAHLYLHLFTVSHIIVHYSRCPVNQDKPKVTQRLWNISETNNNLYSIFDFYTELNNTMTQPQRVILD